MPAVMTQEQSPKPKSPIVSDTGQGWFLMANMNEDERDNSIKFHQNNIVSDCLKTLKPINQDGNGNDVSNSVNLGTGTQKHEVLLNVAELQGSRLKSLRMEIEELGSQIDSGKSNFPFVAVGLGALGLSGLGILGYSIIKGVINFLHSGKEQRKKLKREERKELFRETVGDGYQTDRCRGHVKRLYARDFKTQGFCI